MKKTNSTFLKFSIAFLAIVSGMHSFAQTKKPGSSCLTKKYAGEYSYGKKDNRVGYVTIYPESDTTILFYFESNRGAPSYNMGSLYARVKIVKDTAVYFSQADSDKGCKFGFKFSKGRLVLKTIDDFDNCGFGHAVFVDGTYKQYSTKIPLSFTNLESKEIFFNKMSPEDYLK